VETGEETQYYQCPQTVAALDAKTKYLYFCANETISGLEYQPATKECPWVADMTSSLLTAAIDFQNYGLIFAGAQKNIANAGLTVVILRRDFLPKQAARLLPRMDDYRLFIQEKSLFATPPTFNIYLMNRMLKWVMAQGGLAYFADLSAMKSKLLYDFLDDSKNFHTYIQGKERSRINVTFTTKDPERDLAIVKQAEEAGLYGLKGHRALGGLRASLYNAMPLSGVESLINFLASVKF
jgi:phosphoserine aminotransferase